MDNLSYIPTKDLIKELKSREGVNIEIAEPYKTINLSINGPAIVLVVID